MASKRGGLVAERVKMMERGHVNVTNSNVTFCHGIPSNMVSYVQHTPKGKSSRLKRPLRAAPAVPHQRRAAPSAPSAPAESVVPLLLAEPHDSHSAPSRVRVLPSQNGAQCYIFSPPESANATGYVKTSEHSGPQEHVNTPWGMIRDHVSTATSRIQSASPLASIRGNFSSMADRFEKTVPNKKREFRLCLLILACLIFLVFFRKGFTGGDQTELDEYLHNLNYSPDELLVYQGDSLNAIPKEGVLNKNRCIMIERRKKSISNGRSEIGVVSSNEHRTFPGSLILANRRLMENAPDLLAVDRAPLTYTVNLPGLTSEGSFTIVPSFSEYQSAVNRVLNTWFEKYPNDRSAAANFQSIESFAHSKELLRIKFGFDFMDSVIESSIDFNAMAKGEKLIKIFKFTQVFYTVTVEPTKNPSDLFDSSVTLNEVARKTDDSNPPVLVDSVSYGRNIYVKIETSSVGKQAELKLAVLETKNGVEKAYDLKDLNIQVYVVGGHTNHTELINVEEANEVHNIITQFSKFSKHNLGYPISYSSHFIRDNQKAVVHLSTDFVESVRHDNCQKGIIKLIQKVWFGKWEVTWTEISFDGEGNNVTKKREWDRNSKVMKLPFESEDIEISGYVEDLRVVAKVHSVLDSWRTLIDRSNIPVIHRREFYINSYSTGEVKPPI